MITGVTTPFVRKLILEGIGYKSEVKGANLVLALGFSHPVNVPIPATLKVTAEKNIITATGLIQEVTEKASEKNADPLIAEQVALGAIKYMILRQAPGSDIIFDEEKSLSLEGDSGPYLQYALVRARSVLEKAPPTSEVGAPTPEDVGESAPTMTERVIVALFPAVSFASYVMM